MRLTITNGFNWAVNIQPGPLQRYGFQFAEDLSIVKGDHQLGIGAELHSVQPECEFGRQHESDV